MPRRYTDEKMGMIIRRMFSLTDDAALNDEIRERLLSGGKITGTNVLVMVCAILIASMLNAATVYAQPEVLGVMTAQYYQYAYSDDYSQEMFTQDYATAQLTDDSAAAYPLLADSLDQLAAEMVSQAQQNYAENMTETRLDRAAQGDAFAAYSYEANPYIRRADSGYTSILFAFYQYLGGAHGYGWYEGHTYDSQTGQELTVTDILSQAADESALLEAVKAELKAAYPDLSGWESGAVDSITADSLYWSLEYDGITLYFSPYTLGAYAEGAQIIRLTFADYPQLFAAEVQDVPDAYIVQLPFWQTMDVDVDGDGVNDTVTVGADAYEDWAYTQLSVAVNDHTLNVDTYFYDAAPSLVFCDGKTYLYVEESMESDYRQIAAFALDSTGAALTAEIAFAPVSAYDTHEQCVRCTEMTDPHRLLLQMRTNIFGTTSVSAAFAANTDDGGEPYMSDEWLTYTSEITLTARQDIETTQVDNSGSTVGTVTIPAGSSVMPLRTDGETWGDVLLPDGTIARLQIEKIIWPITANGVDIEEMFDGIMYAS